MQNRSQGFVIPAQAGIQNRGIVPSYRRLGHACMLDSRLRGNDVAMDA